MAEREELVRRAEVEVLEAATAWAQRRARNPIMAEEEQRLYNAVTVLRSVKRATGDVKLPVLPKK